MASEGKPDENQKPSSKSLPIATFASHYFDDNPTVASKPQTVTLTLPDLHMTMQSDRGVFGINGIDPGTKYLLMDGPRPPSPLPSSPPCSFLDLGCGYGPIALTLAKRAPEATVWAVDINGRARDLTLVNAQANGCDRIHVAAPDEVPEALSFDGIWSNPPIRIGKPALHALLLRWLPRLRPQATACLVVQKHLGSDSLAKWLVSEGYAVSRLGSRAGYRLLTVTPQPTEPS